MKDRREKGLCYHCDSKWSLGHKCQKLKLYILEEVWDDKDDVVDGEKPAITTLDLAIIESILEISLHAITSSLTLRTIRVKGKVVSQRVTILIDTGSTHNFLDPVVVFKGQLPINSDKKVRVRVAK